MGWCLSIIHYSIAIISNKNYLVNVVVSYWCELLNSLESKHHLLGYSVCVCMCACMSVHDHKVPGSVLSRPVGIASYCDHFLV